MSEMQAIYGNAASSEKLKEQFYSASQSDGESVVDYSLRLERLLSSQINISQEEKNKMLCNKLWSGLCNKELKNATRYKFESTKEYSALRRELRQVELEMGSTITKKQMSVSVESDSLKGKVDKLIEPVASLTSRISSLENNVEALKKI